MKRVVLTGLISCFFVLPAVSQHSGRKYIREGNKAYNQKKYANAEVEYRKAQDVAKNTVIPDYNLGTALYEQKKYDKAADNFLSVAEHGKKDRRRADAFYNLGNTLLQAKKIDGSIEAYKNALKYNPDDMDAKYNLLYAMNMKKQQKKQQKQNKNQKQGKNKQDKNKQNQQNKKQNQQQQKQQNQQQQQAQNRQQNQKKNQQQNKPQPGKISKQDAERLLQALANDEKKIQAKVKKAKAKQNRVKSGINW